MYNVEKFIKNNLYDIKRNSANKEVADNVINELKQVQAIGENDFLAAATKIFDKYNVKRFTVTVDSYIIEDIDLYDYWMHHSDN